MFTDTHCHIHDKEYHFDPKAILEKAHYAGVDKIIVIGTSPRDSLAARDFAATHADVYWSYGFHPGELTDDVGAKLAEVSFSELVTSHAPIAIGEIGLDYHYKPYDRTQQIHLLEQMLDLANHHHLPVIFHIREAFPDFWPIVDNAGTKDAVLHSFAGDEADLSRALDHGFYLGVNGLATFTSIPIPPLPHILLETDAPYLTPSPFRGKINEPAYIPEIASWVANHLGVTLEEVAEATTKNAERLFHI